MGATCATETTNKRLLKMAYVQYTGICACLLPCWCLASIAATTLPLFLETWS